VTNVGYGANQLVAYLDSSDSDDLDRVKYISEIVKISTDQQLSEIVSTLLTISLRRRMGPKLLLQEEQNTMMRVFIYYLFCVVFFLFFFYLFFFFF
jgi:predicted site-specific integrase-resolvase